MSNYRKYDEDFKKSLVNLYHGGKTLLLFSIIHALLKAGAHVEICDPKKSDLKQLNKLPVFKDKVYWDMETVSSVLRRHGRTTFCFRISYQRRYLLECIIPRKSFDTNNC
ncbi:hypothetical protein LT175_002488 [Enterococcus faecalis]|nr:hypothetical protein [Enterococcus faecalis]EIP8085765.1 hypothetical protein [Enterococcus faecalis]ELS0446135.1 hypothetical protein [Enterococcus faecalis]HBI2014127.1 hypothetical protein [Enterococcus faecalis]